LPLYETITKYIEKWKLHLQREEKFRISFQDFTHGPSGRRDVERPRRRCKEISEAEKAIRLLHKVMMIMTIMMMVVM
jgi:hypothetical protein